MTVDMRWGGLRPEPYNPNAVDADNDGIVQEGTPWERPAGTFIISELGEVITSGRIERSRPRGLRIVDANGNRVDYTPSYLRPGGATERPPDYLIQHMGVPSLRDMGLPTVGEVVSPPDETPVEAVRTAETGAPVDASVLTHADGVSGVYAPVFNQWFEVPELDPGSVSDTPAGSQHLAAKVRFDDPNARQLFGQALNDLSRVHGVPFEEDTAIVRVLTTTEPLDPGGSPFRSAAYLGADEASNAVWGLGSEIPGEPFGQIRIAVALDEASSKVGNFSDPGVDDTVRMLSFLEAFGERLDFRVRPDPESPGGATRDSWARRGTPAMQKFLSGVTDLSRHQERLDAVRDSDRAAYLDPGRVFARFYAQWAAARIPGRGDTRFHMAQLTESWRSEEKFDDAHLAGLRHLYFFSPEEMESLTPAFEDALREMGLTLKKDVPSRPAIAETAPAAGRVVDVVPEVPVSAPDVLPASPVAAGGANMPSAAEGAAAAARILAQRVDSVVPLSPDGSRSVEGIQARNRQVADAVEVAGGALFDIDDAYVERFKRLFGETGESDEDMFKYGRMATDFRNTLKSVEEGVESRRKFLAANIEAWRDPSQSKWHPNEIATPGLKDYALTKPTGELIEEFESVALAFRDDIDPTIRVAVAPNELELILSDPDLRYRTVHEVGRNPDGTGPAQIDEKMQTLRRMVETLFGFPPDKELPVELRPVSGFVRLSQSKEKMRRDFEKFFGRPPLDHEELDYSAVPWDGGQPEVANENYESPNRGYGSMSLVLRPEVAERAGYGYGDSFNSRVQQAPLIGATDEQAIAAALPDSLYGKTSIKSQISDLVWPYLKDGDLTNNGFLPYTEVTIAGGFDLRDVAEIETGYEIFKPPGDADILKPFFRAMLTEEFRKRIADEGNFTEEQMRTIESKQLLEGLFGTSSEPGEAAQVLHAYQKFKELEQRVGAYGVKLTLKMPLTPKRNNGIPEKQTGTSERFATRLAALVDLEERDAVRAYQEVLLPLIIKRLNEGGEF